SHLGHWLRIDIEASAGGPTFHASLEKLPLQLHDHPPESTVLPPVSVPEKEHPAFGDIATPTLLPLPPLSPTGLAEPGYPTSTP
ncbi:MAG: hypothetical protein ACRYGL_03915, partial [Janthinobacterium lividum]